MAWPVEGELEAHIDVYIRRRLVEYRDGIMPQEVAMADLKSIIEAVAQDDLGLYFLLGMVDGSAKLRNFPSKPDELAPLLQRFAMGKAPLEAAKWLLTSLIYRPAADDFAAEQFNLVGEYVEIALRAFRKGDIDFDGALLQLRAAARQTETPHDDLTQAKPGAQLFDLALRRTTPPQKEE